MSAKRDDLFEGRYEIGKLLGEGGMGVVHAAVNVYSGAQVAIKRIPKEVAERHAFGGRLLSESRVLARLDHPNIVRLLDCGPITGGGLYIAMELVDGEPLRALIRSAGKRKALLDLDLVLLAIAQTAEAMEFAHRKNVYHRDLKPENIMVCQGGLVKVVDFGLAKTPSVGKLPGVSPTNPANVVGTPRYMAPEQVRGQAIDARTDIYALGVVLYEAVSGRTPYDSYEDAGTTVTEIMGHHVFADPTPVREHVPTCPDRVWRIMMRCLAKVPKDRYPDMASLARDVRAALEEMVAPPVRRPPAVPSPSIQPVDEPVSPLPRTLDAPRQDRPTAPMPETFRLGDPLPFSSSAPTAANPPPREARVTEPMPPISPSDPLPFVRAPEPRRLGKGHTQPMPSAATLLAAQGMSLEDATEPSESRSAVPPPPSVPPQPSVPAATFASAEPLGRLRDSGDAAARSGPGFAFEPTTPGTSRLPEVPAPADASPSAGRKARMRISPYLVPPVGLVIAVLAMVAVMKLRDPREARGARALGAGSTSAPPVAPPTSSASATATTTTVAPAPPSSVPEPSAAPAQIAATAPSAEPSVPRAPATGIAHGRPATSGTWSPRRRRVAPVYESPPDAPPGKARNRLFGADQ